MKSQSQTEAASPVTFTRLRRLVLEILVQAAGPVKAYDLLEKLRDRSQRLTPSTVYRILDYLENHGLIHRVDALNAYLACTGQPHSHHPLIVVCSGCQKTREINDQDLYQSIFRKLEALGLTLTSGSIEIKGVCDRCAQEA
ncbi:MAG: transcriptional repressor [Deltaproteobacteria bacterium]|jgi:Fur family zinc uptake transcriptional regulator|nr:transcriptional repressor [Deltaproteobacteria bacterium]